jgi:hypothetical protein
MDLVVTLATIAGTALGVYGAIRADLAALHVKSDIATKIADHAHERIDSILMRE